MSEQGLSLKHVRRNCIECCAGDKKYLIWCTCDGLHSTRCEFWPFRFGMQPKAFKEKYGDRLLTPEKMPPAEISLEDLPGTLKEAAMVSISIKGYEQSEVHVKAPSAKVMAERRRRMEKARRALQDSPAGAKTPV